MHEVPGAFRHVHETTTPLPGLRLCEWRRGVGRFAGPPPALTAPSAPQVVCGKCSDNKVALEYDGNKPNKVCDSCFSALTAQRDERVEGRRRPTPEARGLEVVTSFYLIAYKSDTNNCSHDNKPGTVCVCISLVVVGSISSGQ